MTAMSRCRPSCDMVSLFAARVRSSPTAVNGQSLADQCGSGVML
jgi:hypothetical protein